MEMNIAPITKLKPLWLFIKIAQLSWMNSNLIRLMSGLKFRNFGLRATNKSILCFAISLLMTSNKKSDSLNMKR